GQRRLSAIPEQPYYVVNHITVPLLVTPQWEHQGSGDDEGFAHRRASHHDHLEFHREDSMRLCGVLQIGWLLALLSLLGSVPRRAAAANVYRVIDLGALPGGSSSVGFGLNAVGQVVGAADTADGNLHAVLSGPNGGPLADLG